jgi:ring-1,2-phenylacetyl-CoA epoxidase subunit PaaC
MQKQLIKYVQRLGDNALILGQRLGEWCGHGPVLEQDIALTNIALDTLGQARLYFQYVAALKGGGLSEDDVAFIREEREYNNLLLLEQKNKDWAYTIVRQFLFDVFSYYNLNGLLKSSDSNLKAIAARAIKEVKYHKKFSSEWMIRLGDGTELSHQKIQNALNDLWIFTGEMFKATDDEELIATMGIGPACNDIQPLWELEVNEILKEATLQRPDSTFMRYGGKEGTHSEHMGFILAELQYMQRTFPGMQW